MLAEPEPDREPKEPEGEVSKPSFWPIVLALGVAMSLIGVITKIEVVIVGLVVVVVALGGWVLDARREYRSLS